MKSSAIIVNWHNDNAPVYSAHFEPDGKGSKGRLATGGGDNNVRIWKLHKDGEERRVEYLSTLAKHTQAVNVVRWCPKGELLASAGDDGNIILWTPSDTPMKEFGSEEKEDDVDKESWRPKHMCRSSGAEIYDLAWSPDGQYFIVGSMDNVARIYSASTGTIVRQIAEHSHYVQGVAWDPLNEYVATQSSDRTVHVYSLKNKNGSHALDNVDEKPNRIANHMRADLPSRRISSNSPAPPDMGYRSQLSVDAVGGSPVPSAPGTPTSHPLPMNPPTSAVSHSRRSSFSSRRSVSPAPSLPLPAVMPMEASPKPHAATSVGVKNATMYANETLTSFFRRLTFTNDGSLLLTPAGQYQDQHQQDGKSSFEVINTVFIYTRGGINRPPIAHLPGHKKPSIVVKCSPLKYTLRTSPPVTKHITIDTSSKDDMPPLPESLSKSLPSVMEPPPPPLTGNEATSATPKGISVETSASTAGPKPTFALPYRMVYAVATQDSVLLYDTQQTTPICVVSNLHLATFTDLAWSSDGQTLLISSSDGFCSTIAFADGELGQKYVEPKKTPSAQNTPTATPTSGVAPPFAAVAQHQHRNSANSFAAPSPPAATFASQRPSSPARSNSTSSVATTQSAAQPPPASIPNATLIAGSVPGIAATNSAKVTGVPITTPPETPRSTTTSVSVAGTKRDASESEKEDAGKDPKKRRIAPTPVVLEAAKEKLSEPSKPEEPAASET
ncbi:WD40 repeat-like-containing domain protein [Zalerion maritima]|uniref:WD40 repeat-like-containing domain protein n=1 Tax=Zalerion maritima TaxID=339359 RepID=A0AAD5RUL8_9PEZI|nr:WD40 repeat-like-containing domain protein [Zalerion maritima]